jgi:hypothetical protein
MDTQATAYLRDRPLALPLVSTLAGVGSHAKTARDPTPLRYVGVRLVDSELVVGRGGGPGRENIVRGRRTSWPVVRAGRACQKTRVRLGRHPKFP